MADGLALTQAKTALASVGRFELVDAEADMTEAHARHRVVHRDQPQGPGRARQREALDVRALAEGAAGGSRAARRDAKVAAPKDPSAEAPPPGANTKPWELSIGTVAVDNGALSYADKASATPVAFELSALNVKRAEDHAEHGHGVAAQAVGAHRRRPRGAGRFDYKGNVVLKPMAAEGRLVVASIPAHAFKAYYADALNIDIRRAFASYRGTVKFATLPAGMSLRAGRRHRASTTSAPTASSLTQAPGLSTQATSC